MRRFAVLAIALAACEKAGDGHKTVELPLPTISVRLIDPGAEPRAPIRLRAQAGELRRARTLTIGALETPFAQPLPTTTRTTQSYVAGVSADGVAHLRERVLDASDRKGVGWSFEIWQGARGELTRPMIVSFPETDTFPSEGGEPEALFVAPTEAIGADARWHEDISYRGQVASLDVVLVARDDDRRREIVRYHVDGTLDGDPLRRDGTMWLSADDAHQDGTLSKVETFLIDGKHGPMRGTLVTYTATLR